MPAWILALLVVGYLMRFKQIDGLELLEELRPDTRRRAERWLDRVNRRCISWTATTGLEHRVLLTSGRRTREEQRQLFLEGRSKLDGSPGRESYHQLGQALDFVMVIGGVSQWQDPPPAVHMEAVAIAEAEGFRSGARWTWTDVYHLEDGTR